MKKYNDKQIYESPEAYIEEAVTEDLITTSNEGFDEGDEIEF